MESDDDFEKLMQEIEGEAHEAAQGYFDDLYGAVHDLQELADERSDYSELLEEFSVESASLEDEAIFGQRIGNLKLKLDASPDGSFPVSPFSRYCDDKWVLLEEERVCRSLYYYQ